MGEPRGRAPSIRDVASEAGVSHQTVSRVLNNHPSIRPATEARVREVMTRLGYRPNRAARTLVTSRHHTIGLLVAGRGQWGPSSASLGVEEAARAAGYTVASAALANEDFASMAAAIDSLVSHGVDGLVVIAPHGRALDAVRRSAPELPAVALHRVSGTGEAVVLDQEGGARAATRHLIDLGHTRIAHLAGPQDWVEAEARLQGFTMEMRDHGLPLRPHLYGDWSADAGYAAGRVLLATDVTAVFVANDQMALGLLHAVAEAGLRVPQDLSVVGFDDIPEARHFSPPLTTVRQDFAELGRRAIAVLLEEIEPGRQAAPHTVVPTPLVVRSSTAAPPAAR
jgi:DNA-binding LacI/PurR family transcriptional regulator